MRLESSPQNENDSSRARFIKKRDRSRSIPETNNCYIFKKRPIYDTEWGKKANPKPRVVRFFWKFSSTSKSILKNPWWVKKADTQKTISKVRGFVNALVYRTNSKILENRTQMNKGTQLINYFISQNARHTQKGKHTTKLKRFDKTWRHD